MGLDRDSDACCVCVATRRFVVTRDSTVTVPACAAGMLKQLMNGEAGRAHSDAGSDPDSHHGVLSDSEDAAGAQPAARALGDISNSASQTPVPVKVRTYLLTLLLATVSCEIAAARPILHSDACA